MEPFSASSVRLEGSEVELPLRAWTTLMTTFETGVTDVPLPRKRSVMALATAVLAVAGFVGVSLVLQSLTHRALAVLGLVEDAYGQCAQYIVVTAVSTYAVRKAFDLGGIRYSGKVIVGLFLTISIMVLAAALSSGVMKVDFLISLLQMSALCGFAYLQFWRHGGRGRPG